MCKGHSGQELVRLTKLNIRVRAGPTRVPLLSGVSVFVVPLLPKHLFARLQITVSEVHNITVVHALYSTDGGPLYHCHHHIELHVSKTSTQRRALLISRALSFFFFDEGPVGQEPASTDVSHLARILRREARAQLRTPCPRRKSRRKGV